MALTLDVLKARAAALGSSILDTSEVHQDLLPNLPTPTSHIRPRIGDLIAEYAAEDLQEATSTEAFYKLLRHNELISRKILDTMSVDSLRMPNEDGMLMNIFGYAINPYGSDDMTWVRQRCSKLFHAVIQYKKKEFGNNRRSQACNRSHYFFLEAQLDWGARPKTIPTDFVLRVLIHAVKTDQQDNGAIRSIVYGLDRTYPDCLLVQALFTRLLRAHPINYTRIVGAICHEYQCDVKKFAVVAQKVGAAVLATGWLTGATGIPSACDDPDPGHQFNPLAPPQVGFILHAANTQNRAKSIEKLSARFVEAGYLHVTCAAIAEAMVKCPRVTTVLDAAAEAAYVEDVDDAAAEAAAAADAPPSWAGLSPMAAAAAPAQRIPGSVTVIVSPHSGAPLQSTSVSFASATQALAAAIATATAGASPAVKTVTPIVKAPADPGSKEAAAEAAAAAVAAAAPAGAPSAVKTVTPIVRPPTAA